MSEHEGGCCGGSSAKAGQGGAQAGGCCGGGGGGGGGGGEIAFVKPKLGVPIDRDAILALPTVELVRRFRRGVENFDRRLFELTDEQLDQAFLPDAGVGRWPVRVLLGHLADAQLVNVHRIRRALAEDNPLFAVWDEGAFVDSNIYGVEMGPSAAGSVPAFIAVIHTLRTWTGMWLAGLSEAQLARAAMHPQRGPMTVRGIISDDTWHLEHHAAYLNAKVERFLGPVSAAEPAAAGGSCGGAGGGCGCHG